MVELSVRLAAAGAPGASRGVIAAGQHPCVGRAASLACACGLSSLSNVPLVQSVVMVGAADAPRRRVAVSHRLRRVLLRVPLPPMRVLPPRRTRRRRQSGCDLGGSQAPGDGFLAVGGRYGGVCVRAGACGARDGCGGTADLARERAPGALEGASPCNPGLCRRFVPLGGEGGQGGGRIGCSRGGASARDGSTAARTRTQAAPAAGPPRARPRLHQPFNLYPLLHFLQGSAQSSVFAPTSATSTRPGQVGGLPLASHSSNVSVSDQEVHLRRHASRGGQRRVQLCPCPGAPHRG
jgi:hypothetical protein